MIYVRLRRLLSGRQDSGRHLRVPGFGRAAIVAILLLPAIAACDNADTQQTATQRPPPAVTVMPVVTAKVSDATEFVGRTRANQSVELRARVSGFLIERDFVEGSPVTARQTLFKIDPAEFEAARKAAAAEVERIEASLVEAGRNLKRAKELAKRGNISQANVDKAIADEAETRAALAAAKAQLDSAEINLSYTVIETPIAGKAGAAKIDVGNLIGPDSGVLTTVLDTDPIRVEFAISERELLNHQERKRAGTAKAYTPRIRLANGKMYETPGTVTFIDNQVDPRTGTIAIRAEFPNPDGTVTAGQFVQIVLRASQPRDALVVPQAAVQTNQAGPFVLVVGGDDTVEARPVTLGERDGGNVAVTDGLRAGELVVVAGLQKARPGAKVKPVKAAGETPAATGS